VYKIRSPTHWGERILKTHEEGREGNAAPSIFQKKKYED